MGDPRRALVDEHALLRKALRAYATQCGVPGCYVPTTRIKRYKGAYVEIQEHACDVHGVGEGWEDNEHAAAIRLLAMDVATGEE